MSKRPKFHSHWKTNGFGLSENKLNFKHNICFKIMQKQNIKLWISLKILRNYGKYRIAINPWIKALKRVY